MMFIQDSRDDVLDRSLIIGVRGEISVPQLAPPLPNVNRVLRRQVVPASVVSTRRRGQYAGWVATKKCPGVSGLTAMYL